MTGSSANNTKKSKRKFGRTFFTALTAYENT